MLLEAFNWTGEERFTAGQIRRDPAVFHYVAGWPGPGDLGVIAEDPDGSPAGAAWARRFPADDPGYGFVAPDVPELSLAVAPEHRGRGVGSALLDALIDRARAAGVPGLSLSVEDGNAARRLYTARGFTPAGRSGDSDTLLLPLEGVAGAGPEGGAEGGAP
jgi:GNAT superfamily N-acetyltransferase